MAKQNAENDLDMTQFLAAYHRDAVCEIQRIFSEKKSDSRSSHERS